MDGSQVNWLLIKWMHFDGSCPGVMQFKYRINDDRFLQMDMAAGRVIGWQHELHSLYNNRLCISSAKKKDLFSLIRSRIIPEEYVDFYLKLPDSQQIDDHLPFPSSDEVQDAVELEEDSTMVSMEQSFAELQSSPQNRTPSVATNRKRPVSAELDSTPSTSECRTSSVSTRKKRAVCAELNSTSPTLNLQNRTPSMSTGRRRPASAELESTLSTSENCTPPVSTGRKHPSHVPAKLSVTPLTAKNRTPSVSIRRYHL